MKWIILPLCLVSQFAFSKELAKMIVYENGQTKTVYYDNTYPQCVSFKFFIGNTISNYKGAYVGNQSLKKADENVSDNALDIINIVMKKNLPLPYSYSDLLKDAGDIKRIIFSKQEIKHEEYISNAYKKCVKVLIKNGYIGNSNNNYDQEVDYSKGQDRVEKIKITKVEQVCDSKDFPELMQRARIKIRRFSEFRKLTTEQFLLKINYKYINRLAEDMFQANLDDGTISDQFLWDVYNMPKRGLEVGNLPPRCAINQ
ncbi:hypothetical protein E0H77_09565 [Acinetobacter sp. ANC 4633]|uniref:hypothetical protein n=1 Tax=Acinetobacter sp. ANC 4633 TaxID=2529845 RepID=UPI00104075A7|nr:hypothetical protein [Acinetobacter sp. ANC 4633]TCB25310.1 hypothetical protein E0H77_09565 [Acinetobacter sp. ANC 4633]